MAKKKPGPTSEAATYIDLAADLWLDTPGGIEWVAEFYTEKNG